MTKTPRVSSYLHKIAGQYDRQMPFLKPSRVLARHWGTMKLHDQAAETARLTPQSPMDTGTIPLLQAFPALAPQHEVEQPSTRPTRKIALPAKGAQEVTSRSSTSTQPSKFYAPVTLPDSTSVLGIREQPPQAEIQLAPAKSTPMRSLSVTEETTSGIRKQPSQVEIQLAPAKSMQSVAAEASRPANAAQVPSDRQTRASGRELPARITLRPQSQQQEATPLTSTNSRHTVDLLGWENKTSARESRPAVLPHKQETQQRTAIQIGTIEIHVMPPAPAAPLPPARSTTVRSRSTPPLSREMMSLIGLRQG